MSSRLSETFLVGGRYEITERPLGEGATGLVYKAYDIGTKRFVTLKALWPDARPDCFGGRWAVLSRLRHPNIVEILDTGVWLSGGEQRPYFVAPLLAGGTLAGINRPLAVERAIDIVAQACHGLQAANEQGLIHGDIGDMHLRGSTGSEWAEHIALSC
jgi:serine/threonine-protein kinase